MFCSSLKGVKVVSKRTAYRLAGRENPEELRFRDEIWDVVQRLMSSDKEPMLVDPVTGDRVDVKWVYPGFLSALANNPRLRIILDRKSQGMRVWYRFPRDRILMRRSVEDLHSPMANVQDPMPNEDLASPEQLKELFIALTTWTRQPARPRSRR